YVNAVLRAAVHVGWNIFARQRFSDDLKFPGSSQRNFVDLRYGQLRSSFDQLAIVQLLSAVPDCAILCLAVLRIDSPPLRRRRNQHLASRCSRLPHRHKHAGHAAAPTRALIAETRGIGNRLLDANIVPIDREFVRENHGQRRENALAHFGFGTSERNGSVRINLYPSLKRIHCGTLWWALRCLNRLNFEANRQYGSSSGCFLQESSPGDHNAPPRFTISSAAFSTAARMRCAVPQRQMLLDIALSTSAAVGFGFFLRNATAVMICPDWQY